MGVREALESRWHRPTLLEGLGAVGLVALFVLAGGPIGGILALAVIILWPFATVPFAVGIAHLGAILALPSPTGLAPLLAFELAVALGVLGRLGRTAPSRAKLAYLPALGLLGVAALVGYAAWNSLLGSALAAVIAAALLIYGVHRYEVAWREMEGYT